MEKVKRYYLDINDILDAFVGTYADIADYYTTKNGFTIVMDLGGEEEKMHITNKEIASYINGKNLVWKNDKEGNLDRLVFEKI